MPASNGEIITSVHDRYFRHAPAVTWADDGSRDGVLMVIGQLLRDKTSFARGHLSNRVAG